MGRQAATAKKKKQGIRAFFSGETTRSREEEAEKKSGTKDKESTLRKKMLTREHRFG